MRLGLDLHGPALTWPRPVDAGLEWWARLPNRARALLRLLALGVLALAATGGLLEGPWGPPRDVLVTVHDLPPGQPVTGGDVRVVPWPRDLVPERALATADALPDAAVAHGALAAGVVLTADNVRAAPAVAVAGTAVVPVPADVLPALPVGTTIDVAAASLDGRARIIARAATVVADDGTWRWLRVARADVAEVAAGIGSGALVAAVVHDG